MKRALVSVSDKQNLVPFVKGLVENGFEIISTGGTKRVLDEAGIETIGIEDVTHFPEILDGRVKTLNPYVHGGYWLAGTYQNTWRPSKNLILRQSI